MHTRTLLLGLTLVAALAALAVGAYGAWFHVAPGTAHADLVGNDPRILVWQQRYSGMDATLVGTLRYASDTRCLYIDEIESRQAWGIVWPKGTRPVVEEGRRGVRVGGFVGQLGGAAVLDGDRTSIGGGASSEIPDRLLQSAGCHYDVLWRVHGNVQVHR